MSEAESGSEMRRGGCVCGAVRFAVRPPLRGVVYCHCTTCRRQSGHVVAATRAADAGLSVEGEDHLTWFSATAEARRGFCRVCGSLLFWKREGSDATSIMAGSFDTPSGLTPAGHIFVGEKGDYYAIADGLPQSAGGSAAIQTLEA